MRPDREPVKADLPWCRSASGRRGTDGGTALLSEQFRNLAVRWGCLGAFSQLLNYLRTKNPPAALSAPRNLEIVRNGGRARQTREVGREERGGEKCLPVGAARAARACRKMSGMAAWDGGCMRQAVVGLLAHVDAGKTTLAEAMLAASGAIRVPGSVDDGSTHLDTDAMERERGITIFSATASRVTPRRSGTCSSATPCRPSCS